MLMRLSLGCRLQNKALIAANEIMNVFGRGDLAGIKRARKLADEVFGEGWEKKGADIYKEGAQRASVWGIGQYVFSLSSEDFLLADNVLP